MPTFSPLPQTLQLQTYNRPTSHHDLPKQQQQQQQYSGYLQEAQLMLTTGSTRLAVSRS